MHQFFSYYILSIPLCGFIFVFLASLILQKVHIMNDKATQHDYCYKTLCLLDSLPIHTMFQISISSYLCRASSPQLRNKF